MGTIDTTQPINRTARKTPAPRAGSEIFEPPAETSAPLPADLPSVAAPAPIPPQVAAAATGMPTPLTLATIAPALAKPFSQALVEVKPQKVTENRQRALFVPFVDMRAYFARLDRVVGVEGWSTSYTMTARGVVCRLTILGVTKAATGDYPLDGKDENPATSAEAQAFKRACAAFGLGRYLYALPSIWADYDEKRKAAADPARVVWEMYQQGQIANGGE